MRYAITALGGALVGAAVVAGGILWLPGLVLLAGAYRMDERDRRPRGRYVDHRRGWR